MNEEQYQKDINEIKQSLHDIKTRLFDPDEGLYTRVAANTQWRRVSVWVLGTVLVAMLTLLGKLLAG